MTLLKYFEEIESFEFGAQFAIFSGFSLVLSDMAENTTLQELVGELRQDGCKTNALLSRIRHLLQIRPRQDQIAFDGSIASYLYCLRRVDLELGFRASQEILAVPDFWWSAKPCALGAKGVFGRSDFEKREFPVSQR